MIENIRAITIFAETLRQGSFRGAAAHLKMSPSSVSYNVSELEKRLGTALIYRSTRRLSPTDAGKRLFVHAEKILISAEAGLQEITTSDGVLHGQLHITLPSGLIRSDFNQKIADFCQLHTKLKLKIVYTDARQDLIDHGIDLAIRLGEMADSNLKSTRIGTVHRKLVCSPEFAQNLHASSPRDLADQDWIQLEMMPARKTFAHPKLGGQNFGLNIKVLVNSIEAATQMCRYGLGLATPPDYMVHEDINTGVLVEILPEWSVEPIPVYGVRPANEVANVNATALLNYLRGR